MQEIYCAQCGASILAESEADLMRCPSCGKNPRELSRAQKLEQAKEMAAATREPPRKTSFVGKMAIIGILAPFIALWVISSAADYFGVKEKPRPQAEVEADKRRREIVAEEVEAAGLTRAMVRAMVDERLRHSVDFPMFGQETQYSEAAGGRREWVSSGSFFVTNAFNAKIQHTYRVGFRVVTPGRDPHLEATFMEFDGERVY